MLSHDCTHVFKIFLNLTIKLIFKLNKFKLSKLIASLLVDSLNNQNARTKATEDHFFLFLLNWNYLNDFIKFYTIRVLSIFYI